MRRVLGNTTLALGLIAAGCSSGSDTEPPGFTETSDMVYMTANDVEFSMDVYTPAGDGPWPVVVAFHGQDSDLKDASSTTVVAQEAAAQGMLVFTPSWIDFNLFPVTVETYEGWILTASCAVAFAQQYAVDHGGDPTNTVLYGFSAGIGPALFASLQPILDPIPGCATEVPPIPPSGVVLGDGEYFLHSQTFDDAFQADHEQMQSEVAALIDPSYWPEDLDAKFFLWIAATGTNPRQIGDPSDESGWFAQRDPDGSIRADLDRLGQLEDRTITYIDAGELLELRLSEAGIEVTLDEYPGGHTTHDKVPELVGYLEAAATR